MVRHLGLLTEALAPMGVASIVGGPPGTDLPFVEPISITDRPAILADLRAIRQAAVYARKADVVHGHGIRGAWIAHAAARLARKPYVMTAHNLPPVASRGLQRALVGMTVRRADAAIAVSEAVMQGLRALGCREGCGAVILNGIELLPDERDPARLRGQWQVLPGECLVVAAGRLAPEKGFDLLVRAAPLVLAEASHVLFVIAGEGPEMARLQALADANPQVRVALVGHVTDMSGLLRAGDIVCVPSRSEGLGYVAMEAMAAGRPVVASRTGGLPEVVAGGVTGLLVQPDDPVALAGAVVMLAGKRGMRESMGAAGRRLAEKRFTVDAMASATADVYWRVLGGRS